MESKSNTLYLICNNGIVFRTFTKPRFKRCNSGGGIIAKEGWITSGLTPEQFLSLTGIETNPLKITMVNQQISTFANACGMCYRL